MENKIEKILEDLYLIDPSFKKMEKDLKKIIAKLLKVKPNTEFSEDFRQQLTFEIMEKIKLLKKKQKIPKITWLEIVNNFFIANKLAFVAVLTLLIIPSYFYLANRNEQIVQIAQESLDESYEASKLAVTNESKASLSLLDVIKLQAVFADVSNAYNPLKIIPNIQESETDVSKAVNFDEIQNSLNIVLTDEQKKFLQKNKFLLLDIYDKDLAIPSDAIYINADIILHSYDIFIDRYLQQLEEKELYPLLFNLVDKLRTKALENMMLSSHSEVVESGQRIAAYLTVAKVLLETNIIDTNVDVSLQNLEKYKDTFDEDTYAKMKSEISLIVEANQIQPSPLFGIYNPNGVTDYTQFNPRGHYAESPVLRAYFRAMMLFGRQSFYFDSDEGLKDSILFTYLLSDDEIESQWSKLADTTDFIAGYSDDITYRQFARTILNALDDCPPYAKCLAQNLQDFNLTDLLTGESFEKIKEQVAELPAPRILSEDDSLHSTKGFRLFGQKFTFDAWIFNEMTTASEAANAVLPSMPSATFVAGVIGSDMVKNFLPKLLGAELDNEKIWQEILNLRYEFDKLTPQEWLSNINSAWLWSLSPLLQDYKQGYPNFMQSDMYQTKNLQSVLASYTALKHDTLSQKMNSNMTYKEETFNSESQEKVSSVKGFVDPNIEFWNRMIASVKFTMDGLKSREMLDVSVEEKFNTFVEQLSFYRDIASKELQNEEITDAEYEKLISNTFADLQNDASGIVADIHTDAVSGQILYEGVGNPLVMIVFVSDQDMPRLVVGLTLRHFEFTEPFGEQKRLTDENWQEKMENNNTPPTPFYYEDLFVK